MWSELLAWIAALVFCIPGKLGQAIRSAWCHFALGAWGRGSRIGPGAAVIAGKGVFVGVGCHIGPDAFLSADGGRITIGDRTKFNAGVHINASVGGQITFGADCLVGPNVVMRTASHRFDEPSLLISQQGHEVGSIIVEDDVWIAAGAIILPGVTISRGSVIGAGAVVSRSTQPMSINVGVPAKAIRFRGEA
jgi:acetyltransferase-like isoleucine patch superfamily enzyme